MPVPTTGSDTRRSAGEREETDRGSSGDAGAGSTPSIQTRFVDGRTAQRADIARPWPDHMLATKAALEVLARGDGYVLDHLKPANGPGRQDGLWRYPPIVDLRPQPWSFLEGRCRRALAAVLRRPEHDVYVFETEVAPSSREHYALGLMRVDPPRPLHPLFVSDALEALASARGVWLNVGLSWPSGRRTREPTWDAERYAWFIRASIEKLAPESDASSSEAK